MSGSLVNAEQLREHRSELFPFGRLEPLGRAQGHAAEQLDRDRIYRRAGLGLERRRFLAKPLQFRAGNFFESTLKGSPQGAHAPR